PRSFAAGFQTPRKMACGYRDLCSRDAHRRYVLADRPVGTYQFDGPRGRRVLRKLAGSCGSGRDRRTLALVVLWAACEEAACADQRSLSGGSYRVWPRPLAVKLRGSYGKQEEGYDAGRFR